MPHSTDLIATLAAGFSLAFLLGLVAAKLRLPPIVGYLLAGIALGPATPGFVADSELAAELAEIGVMLLMFGVGLHFSLKQLLAVRHIAIPGAVAQIAVATLLGTLFARSLGWSLAAGLTFGLALSVASTVVLLRAMSDRGLLDTVNGKIAVGWLIVEDLVMVLALVLLPVLGATLSGGEDFALGTFAVTIGTTLLKVGAFVVLMLVVGRRVLPWLLERVAQTGSRELFTLSTAGIALGVAYGAAELFDVSYALGAFFAGVIINESELSHRAAAESMPLQDVFAVLFFVSVGMLFNPTILLERPWEVAAALAIVVIGKSLAAFVIVLMLKFPLRTALTVSVSLAQIGEFSFILAGLGVAYNLLPVDAQSLIVATAILSITINSWLFSLVKPLQGWLRRHPRIIRLLERSDASLGEAAQAEEKLTGHAIVIGSGRVGQKVIDQLQSHDLPFVVVDYERSRIDELRNNDINVVYGDAAVEGILESAGLKDAKIVVLTADDPMQARQVVDLARRSNPEIELVVRTHDERELEWLNDKGVELAIMAEGELAASIARYTLTELGIDLDRADEVSKEVRESAVAGRAVEEGKPGAGPALDPA